MLITEIKAKESVEALVNGKAFIINCFGCKEVHFSEKEAVELSLKKNLLKQEKLQAALQWITSAIRTT